MPTVLKTKAVENSTFVVNVAFTDEDGEPKAPVTMLWTLTDEEGTVINDREDVQISSPTESEDIVLSGLDLGLSVSAERYLLVYGTYNSTLGVGLPYKDQVRFVIEDLVAV